LYKLCFFVGRYDYSMKMNLADDVDPSEIAAQCDGFSGSDIAALCTEAASQRSLEHQLQQLQLEHRGDSEMSIKSESTGSREEEEVRLT
jgi:ATP-dependent 26S proteasome regulatory subunit